MCPATLDGDVWEDCRQRLEEPTPTVDDDDLQVLRREASIRQVGEEDFPLTLALGAGHSEVDHLLASVSEETEGDEDRTLDGAGTRLSREHDSVEKKRPVTHKERSRMEGCNGGVEHFRHPADG